jgi:hypothetical protein
MRKIKKMIPIKIKTMILKTLQLSRETFRSLLAKLKIKGVISIQDLLYDSEKDTFGKVAYSVDQNLDYSAKAIVKSDKYKDFFKKNDLSKESSVLKIHFDVMVVGKVPWIIKGKSIVLDGYWDERWAISEQETNKYLPGLPVFYPSQLIEMDKAILITARYDQNYYHWWLDFITKFEQLNRHEIPTNNVIIRKLSKEYEVESIKPFQEKYNIIEVSTDTTYHVKEIYVPLMSSISGQTSSRKIDFIKHNFDKSESTETLRIYVSRQNALDRRIQNHEEFLKLIENYGFKVCLLENMNLKQQIEVFRKSNVVLAPHGAGLTNLVFCRRGIKIIELFNKNYFCSCYFEIAEYLEAEYYYYVDEAENKKSNIYVDIDHFKQFLDTIL